MGSDPTALLGLVWGAVGFGLGHLDLQCPRALSCWGSQLIPSAPVGVCCLMGFGVCVKGFLVTMRGEYGAVSCALLLCLDDGGTGWKRGFHRGMGVRARAPHLRYSNSNRRRTVCRGCRIRIVVLLYTTSILRVVTPLGFGRGRLQSPSATLARNYDGRPPTVSVQVQTSDWLMVFDKKP